MSVKKKSIGSRRWLVTGAAGFIGSHLVEELLGQGQHVVGFDNLSTGKLSNLNEVRSLVGEERWGRFKLVEGNVEDLHAITLAAGGCHVILHEAALGSVPLSIEKPLQTHASNATGFVHVLEAAREHGIRRVVYASSSAVYGNNTELPLREQSAGGVLSPYAASKLVDEIYARAYASSYGMEMVGLRYFNVFGPRQDPNGAYAAVIPRWIQAILSGKKVVINGNGNNTRDFCFVKDVVRANLLAATAILEPGTSLALNVGGGRATCLLDLFDILAKLGTRYVPTGNPHRPTFGPVRSGDILHSTADVGAADKALGYHAECPLEESLQKTLEWFSQFKNGKPAGTEAESP